MSDQGDCIDVRFKNWLSIAEWLEVLGFGIGGFKIWSVQDIYSRIMVREE